MKKITDRFWLGVFAGLGGNVVKTVVEQSAVRMGITTETGPKKAAGIFIKKGQINTPLGKIIGFTADNMIAAALGVTCSYWFTLMGKDKYILKGAGLAALEWTALSGILSRIGATSLYPSKPVDVITAMLSHFAYGATKAALMVKLGDERLFEPKNLTRKISEPQELHLINPKPENNQQQYFH